MMLPTTLERLRVFHAIVSFGSVAAAARQLGYTPSAVSQQLSALERESGTSLVERSSRGVAVTEAGRVLAVRASSVLDLVRDAFDEVAASAGRLDTVLRVAAFPTAISSLLIPAVPRLAPGVRLSVVHAEPQHAVRALLAREVDCAISDHHSLDAADSDDLHRVVVHTEPVQLVTRQRRTQRRALVEYAHDPWVLGGADNRMAAAVRAACLAAGFVPNVVVETDDHHVTFDVIRATGAVSFLPELALRQVPRGLAVVPDIAAPIERRIEFVTRDAMRSNAAVRLLIGALVATEN